MADTTTAAPEAPILRMPYEGREVSVDEAAASLLGSDSHEEHPGDEQDEAHEATPADEAEESGEEATSDDADDEESDATPEDGNTEEDDPLAEKKRQADADYTRKATALANERKAFEAERAEVRAERERYVAGLQQLEQMLASAEPEPDWARLREEDPQGFAVQWAEHQQRREAQAAVRAEREAAEAKHAAEQQEALRARLAEESELLVAKIPEWADEAKAVEGKKALMEWAKKSLGASDEELSSIFDHRWIVLMDKARRYDEMTTKGAAALAEKKAAAPVLKPGHRDPAAKPSGVDVEAKIIRSRLANSGSVEDAAALFLRQSTGRRSR